MIELGGTLPFSSRLYDKAPEDGGVLVNPASATLTITLPPDPVTGLTTTATPTITVPPAVTGTFAYPYVTSVLVGRYIGRWVFTLANGQTSVYTEIFEVGPADPGYIISLADAKKHLQIPAADTSNDLEIRDWLGGITRVIEDKVGVMVPRVVTDYMTGDYENRVLRTRCQPVIAISSITPTYTGFYGRTYTTAETQVTPDGRITNKNGWYFWGGPWTIAYLAGRTIIPANAQLAGRTFLTHLWETQRGGGTPAYLGDSEMSQLPGTSYSVPNRVLELLQPDDEGPGVG